MIGCNLVKASNLVCLKSLVWQFVAQDSVLPGISLEHSVKFEGTVAPKPCGEKGKPLTMDGDLEDYGRHTTIP